MFETVSQFESITYRDMDAEDWITREFYHSNFAPENAFAPSFEEKLRQSLDCALPAVKMDAEVDFSEIEGFNKEIMKQPSSSEMNSLPTSSTTENAVVEITERDTSSIFTDNILGEPSINDIWISSDEPSISPNLARDEFFSLGSNVVDEAGAVDFSGQTFFGEELEPAKELEEVNAGFLWDAFKLDSSPGYELTVASSDAQPHVVVAKSVKSALRSEKQQPLIESAKEQQAQKQRQMDSPFKSSMKLTEPSHKYQRKKANRRVSFEDENTANAFSIDQCWSPDSTQTIRAEGSGEESPQKNLERDDQSEFQGLPGSVDAPFEFQWKESVEDIKTQPAELFPKEAEKALAQAFHNSVQETEPGQVIFRQHMDAEELSGSARVASIMQTDNVFRVQDAWERRSKRSNSIHSGFGKCYTANSAFANTFCSPKVENITSQIHQWIQDEDIPLPECYITLRPTMLNPVKISRTVQQTIVDEFEAIDQLLSVLKETRTAQTGEIRKKRKASPGVFFRDWQPISLYQAAYTSLDIAPLQKTDYASKVPYSSCFGLVNMRCKRAWSRGPNIDKSRY